MTNFNNTIPLPKKYSKFLSLILRHRPEFIGITLDAQGWVAVDTLLTALAYSDCPMDKATLDAVVATNDKQRFSYDPTGQKIRANQGRSLDIDLALTPTTPPDVLYHGTAATTIDVILAQGLSRQSRQHVHLSSDVATAKRVGARHGRPVVLSVQAAQMLADGHRFYRSDNGVWLTDHVPSQYLQVFEKS